MIKTLRLRNFKSFQDTGDLNILPLTVLAGPNSGGKSSILQSLLILKQTLDGPPALDLNLDGRYLQFSSFRELTYGKPTLMRCEVGFDFILENQMPGALAPRYFSGAISSDKDDDVPLSTTISLSFRYREREGEKAVVLNSFTVATKTAGIEGPRLKGRLIKGRYRTTSAGLGVQLPEQLQSKRVQTVTGRYFLPQIMVFEPDEETGHPPMAMLNQIFLNPLLRLEEELRDNLEYLGPLREPPQRAYLHSGTPMTGIGESGQYAAQILWSERNQRVSYSPMLGQREKEATLLEAVNDVFSKIGMQQPVDVRSDGDVVYQILFGLGEPDMRDTVTIADVGFGYSQLLPVLILGLRSHPSSLLLLEQPEIHLHPRLQANLADFLLALAVRGRRIVVETHSDHFINRLRRRIAEDATDELRQKVSILFVQPPIEDGGSVSEPLRIDQYGVIENWPPGFLPEASDEAEAIFLAGLAKRGG